MKENTLLYCTHLRIAVVTLTRVGSSRAIREGDGLLVVTLVAGVGATVDKGGGGTA